jgi:hypothetical protein
MTGTGRNQARARGWLRIIQATINVAKSESWRRAVNRCMVAIAASTSRHRETGLGRKSVLAAISASADRKWCHSIHDSRRTMIRRQTEDTMPGGGEVIDRERRRDYRVEYSAASNPAAAGDVRMRRAIMPRVC